MTSKGKKYPPEPLSPDEARSLIGACSKRAPSGLRNRALLAVLYRAGLRVSEALGLMPKDCDVQTGALRILKGKGGTTRTVGLDAGAWSILQLWLERRRQLGINGRAPVFCTLRGSALSTAYVRAMVRRIGRKAKIEKRVHPHGLRHSHAFELANENVAIHVIQSQLGHGSVATTSRYISHLHPTAVVQAIRAREWSL